MRAIVSKWGNLACVLIPTAMLDAAGLRQNQKVDIHAENGHVVIKASGDDYDLDALIDGITDENRHPATEIGEPVGAEDSWLKSSLRFGESSGGDVLA